MRRGDFSTGEALGGQTGDAINIGVTSSEPLHITEGIAGEFALFRAAFIRDGAQLVVAGRPACPICGRPMDPDGHVCPRSNGHGRA